MSARPTPSAADPYEKSAARHPVPCPLCGSSGAKPLFDLRLSSVVRCHRCAMTYVNPRAESAELQAKLQHWAEKDVVDAERLRLSFDPATLASYAWFLCRLERFRDGARGRLLDIGCATGALLSVARDRGWDAHGIEIGRASASYAREQMGLPVQCTSIFDAPFAAGAFDAVTMVEVIEHLEEPGTALDRIHHWLQPDGNLLVTTPNFDALYRRLFGPRWWVVNCEDEHIVLFTLDTLSRMLENHGFEILYCHVRGIDVVGLVRAARETLTRKRVDTALPGAAVSGYYDMREDKQRFKDIFQRVGLLKPVRLVLRGLNHLFSMRYSPFYCWGEQLVLVARKRRENPSVS